MPLSASHRRYLITEHAIVPIIINALINAGIGWLLFRSVAAVPMRDGTEVPFDLAATAFMIPFMTCLIVTPMVCRQVESGKVTALEPAQIPSSGRSTGARWQRGVFLGLLSIGLIAVPTLIGLSWFGPDDLPLAAFVRFKAAFGALVAVLVAPWIGWWALAEASRRASPA